jgi:hypothetical protein
MGHASGEIRERFQWTFPIVFSRTGPKRLYVGSQHLWMTTTEGKSWQKISPDLTRHDPKTMGPSGGPITKDQTGVETYATIFTIAPSPHSADVIWTGSDDGYVFITRDGGKNWTNVTPRELPEFARISMIEVSPHRPGTAYVSAKRYQLDDRAPYIYRTDDYGRTWSKTVNGIAPDHYVHVVREDPARANLLFAGTEHGMYVSFDNGARWQPFNRNLPDVQVSDLVIKDNDLVVGTHGRSAYVMENITPLRQLNTRLVAQNVVLFKPADAARGLDQSVAITYYLKQPAKQVTIEILDAQGKLVRTFKSEADTARQRADAAGGDDDDSPRGPPPVRVAVRAGTNRFQWDMRSQPATTFPGLIMWAASTNGPRVLPGNYQVRLTADNQPAQTQSFAIRLDPRLPHVTLADLQAQHALAMQVRNRLSQANEAVIAIRDVKGQVDDRVKKANDAKFEHAARLFKDKLSAVEEEIYQVRNQSNQDPLNYPIKLNNKIGALMGAVENVEGRPTAQSQEVFSELSARLDQQLNWLEQVMTRDLSAFNQQWVVPKGLPPIERKAVEAKPIARN